MQGLGKRSSLPNLLKSFTGKYVLKKNTMCNYSYNKNEATMLVALWPSGCCYIFFHFWKSSVRFPRAVFFSRYFHLPRPAVIRGRLASSIRVSHFQSHDILQVTSNFHQLFILRQTLGCDTMRLTCRPDWDIFETPLRHTHGE